MRRILWTWPLVAALLLFLVPWSCHRLRDERALKIVVVDKTVPFEDRIEHRSLFWLLDHLKIVRPDGEPYDRDVDYLGAFPGPVPGDPPQRVEEVTLDHVRGADLLYFADTYGVYEEDLASGAEMKAALERSPGSTAG